MAHKLDIKEVPGNLEQYRWEFHCDHCHWEAKGATKKVVQSMAESHVVKHPLPLITIKEEVPTGVGDDVLEPTGTEPTPIFGKK